MNSSNGHRLPEWAIRLLEWFSTSRNRDNIIGDFAESYHFVSKNKGSGHAAIWYVGQLIRSIPSFITERILFAIPMMNTYRTSAIRNLLKRKFFSSLNIAGLSIGMATCLFIFQYVTFESGYDKFHEHQEDLYRVVIDGITQGNGETRNEKTWFAFESSIREQIPGVIQGTRIHPNGVADIMYQPDFGKPRIYKQPEGLFVEPSFFDLFSYQVLMGDARLALSSIDQMLVSESMARKYFGTENPIGKKLEIQGWTRGSYTVTGVFQDPPERSHLNFEYVLPIQSLLSLPQYSSKSGWTWQNFITYVQLHPDVDPEFFPPLLTNLVRKNTSSTFNTSGSVHALLQPITEIHLQPNGKRGSKYWLVYLFGIVGILVLAIAWMNFVNLTTARAIERAKEVGVRKVIGASRGNLIAQFITEAIMTNGIAFILSTLLVIVCTPLLQSNLGLYIGTEIWMDQTFWYSLAILFLFGVLSSCLYPALIVSRFQPITIIKSQAKLSSRGGLRRTLVTLQFSAATALLIGTVAVFSQLEHMKSSDLGLKLDQVLIVEGPSKADRQGTPDVFKQELLKIPGIQSVSSGAVPGSEFFMDMPARKLGEDNSKSQPFQAVFVDDTFLETYDLELLTGRNFKDAKSDGLSTVLNETGVQLFGFSSAEAAIGQRVVFNETESNYVTIVGVVENFNWVSVKEDVGAIGFLINQSEGPFSIRINSTSLQETLTFVQEAFKTIYVASPYEYFFADERFNVQYQAEQRAGLLFGVFSFFAILVACLGLIGLIAHMVTQRTKEIGIRKILGASRGTIALILIKGLMKSLGIALPLAILISYFSINHWLEAYSERIVLSPFLFVVPCIAVFAMAFLTVSYHTLRAASRNPVSELRSD